MKITKTQIRRIIREELNRVLSEIRDVPGEEFAGAVEDTFTGLPQGTMGSLTDDEIERAKLAVVDMIPKKLKHQLGYYGLDGSKIVKALNASPDLEEVLQDIANVKAGRKTIYRGHLGLSSFDTNQRVVEYLIDRFNIVSDEGELLKKLAPELVRNAPARFLNKRARLVTRLVANNRRKENIRTYDDYERAFIKYAKRAAAGDYEGAGTGVR